MKSNAFYACAVVASLLPACSKSSPPASSVPAAAPAPASSPTTGQVSGKVAPADSVLVVLEPKTEMTFPPQATTPSMDQIGQTFSPPLLFVRTGQPADFKNSDDTLHNVNVKNVETRDQAFNAAIPAGEKYTFTFKTDGLYHVGCDIHPAMSAEIVASSSPFVTLAEADGSFSLADVPPGPWLVRVFSSNGKLQKDVDVKAGANTVVFAP